MVDTTERFSLCPYLFYVCTSIQQCTHVHVGCSTIYALILHCMRPIFLALYTIGLLQVTTLGPSLLGYFVPDPAHHFPLPLRQCLRRRHPYPNDLDILLGKPVDDREIPNIPLYTITPTRGRLLLLYSTIPSCSDPIRVSQIAFHVSTYPPKPSRPSQARRYMYQGTLLLCLRCPLLQLHKGEAHTPKVP